MELVEEIDEVMEVCCKKAPKGKAEEYLKKEGAPKKTNPNKGGMKGPGQ